MLPPEWKKSRGKIKQNLMSIQNQVKEMKEEIADSEFTEVTEELNKVFKEAAYKVTEGIIKNK